MSKLSAGASSLVITPPVGSHMAAYVLRKGISKGVHDDLRTRALVLDDGRERIALVALDIVLADLKVTKQIRSRVRQLTGIKESHVMITVSHTHTSPYIGERVQQTWGEHSLETEYDRVFPEYVAGSVAAADNSLEPASVSTSLSKLDGITVNRRHPDQPADTALGVLRVSRASGGLLAMLINFACHPLIVGGQNLLWTADFPAYTTSFVERSFPGSVCMFVNGAAGDVHPWDYYFVNEHPKHKPTFEEAERFGTTLAAEAIRTSEPATDLGVVELAAKTKPVTLRKRKMPTEETAQKLLTSILKRHKPWTKDTWDPGDYMCTAFRNHPSEYLISSARSLLKLAKDPAHTLTTELQAFRIGDTGIIAVPGEPFSNLGIETRRRSKAKKTFYVGYANDGIGYVPTIEAFTECEHIEYEASFGHSICYGAVPPSSVISKESITKLTSAGVDLVNSVAP